MRQSTIVEHLRSLPGVIERRLRLVRDVEGWPIIPGRAGRIEYHDPSALAVFTDRPRLFRRLLAVPGVRRHQTGDDEARMLFPPAALLPVAAIIGARRRRASSTGRSPAALALMRATRAANEAPIPTEVASAPAFDARPRQTRPTVHGFSARRGLRARLETPEQETPR